MHDKRIQAQHYTLLGKQAAKKMYTLTLKKKLHNLDNITTSSQADQEGTK